MPERMKEVSRIKVKGDVIMGIVRDDVTMLCGSEELWSIAYMAHVGVDSLGHEAYVGVTLRLHKQKDGKLLSTLKESVVLETDFLKEFSTQRMCRFAGGVLWQRVMSRSAGERSCSVLVDESTLISLLSGPRSDLHFSIPGTLWEFLLEKFTNLLPFFVEIVRLFAKYLALPR